MRFRADPYLVYTPQPLISNWSYLWGNCRRQEAPSKTAFWDPAHGAR